MNVINSCLCGKYHRPETQVCDVCGSHVPATDEERRRFDMGLAEYERMVAGNRLNQHLAQLSGALGPQGS